MAAMMAPPRGLHSHGLVVLKAEERLQRNEGLAMTAASAELRHITSNTALVSPRGSQHARAHSPPRSPTSISIPSSPTSVRSSSSAIFERDIEPLSPPSPLIHPTSPANAHRIPRSKTTETIEHSVPSVLDSAAAILASIQNANDVAIVAPAPYRPGSGFVSPIGSFRSRSPSPTFGNFTPGRNSLLLSIPQVRPPSTHVAPAPPAIVTDEASDVGSASDASPVGFAPPSKRLSFVSYADLLTSTPTSTVPLSSLTTAANASEPPPHISSVSYPPTPSAATSLRAFPIDPFPDAGGEWEREGLGRGLEERLDVLYGSPHA